MKTPGEKLLLAAMYGDIAAAERAFAEGAKVDWQGTYGTTPLQWAVRANNLEMAKWLIDVKKADVNQRGQFEHMPLYEAADRGHKEMVELLLDRGAIPDAEERVPYGGSVNAAASQGHTEIVRILDEATDRWRASRVSEPRENHAEDAATRKAHRGPRQPGE